MVASFFCGALDGFSSFAMGYGWSLFCLSWWALGGCFYLLMGSEWLPFFGWLLLVPSGLWMVADSMQPMHVFYTTVTSH